MSGRLNEVIENGGNKPLVHIFFCVLTSYLCICEATNQAGQKTNSRLWRALYTKIFFFRESSEANT